MNTSQVQPVAFNAFRLEIWGKIYRQVQKDMGEQWLN